MSNALAVAAVTATLRTMLERGIRADPDLNDTIVTMQPPDRARDGNNTANQLNLFLYQTVPSAAWRNMDVPRQVMPGETAMPPLSLNLYYLLTAYGRDNDTTQPFSHHVLGKAMSILHDYAVLSPEEIRNATASSLPRSDLDRQIERVRLTLQPLTLEEISKLWTGFQTQCRLSVAYEATVVLIDSTQPTRTPLPVLTRGPQDRGVESQTDLIPPFPALEEVLAPNRQPSVRLGEVLTLKGQHLDGTNLAALFKHPLWTAPVEVGPEPGATATALAVKLPSQPAVWPAGFYTVAVRVQRPGESYRRTTNQIAFSLAPIITTIAPQTAAAGTIASTIMCSPEVRPEQRAALLLGDQEILADAHGVQTNTLTFAATNVGPGDYYVRLRVDGVDSLLVDRSVTPPVFDSTQKVTLT